MIAIPFPAPGTTFTCSETLSHPFGRLSSTVSTYFAFTTPVVASPAQTARATSSRVFLGTDLASGMYWCTVADMIELSKRATVLFATSEGRRTPESYSEMRQIVVLSHSLVR